MTVVVLIIGSTAVSAFGLWLMLRAELTAEHIGQQVDRIAQGQCLQCELALLGERQEVGPHT